MKNIIKNKISHNSVILATIFTIFLSCNIDDYPYYIKEKYPVLQPSLSIAFTIIIDSSGSMGSIFSTVQTALNSMLDSMTTDDYMQFIRTGAPPVILSNWTNDTETISNTINNNLSFGGDTEYYAQAVEFAVDNSMEGKLNVILLFGDGAIEYSGQPPLDEVMSIIAQSTDIGRAVVFTFGIDIYNTAVLTEIAAAGRGEFYVVDDPSNFGLLYNEIKQIAEEWIR